MTAPLSSPLINVQDYSERFTKAALDQKGLANDSEYVKNSLRYAERLLRASLPVIFSVGHLSGLVGYDKAFVEAAVAAPENFYRRFVIPKRSGGDRNIAEPLPSLAEIQTWIYHNILKQVPVSPAAKAFVPGKSLKDSARFHIGQEFVLRIDIENFFPTIVRKRVFGLFRSLGYSSSVSGALSQLCCVDDSLPQGAPTSPYISNLIVRRLDRRLLAFAKSRRLRYTRYADDFTVSGSGFCFEIINFVSKLIAEEGFKVNDGKTLLMRRGGRQTVVGVVVNKKMNAPREYRRLLRQESYFISKHGLDGHLLAIGESRSGARDHYLGKAAFALSINFKERDAISLRKALGARVDQIGITR